MTIESINKTQDIIREGTAHTDNGKRTEMTNHSDLDNEVLST